MRKTLVYTVDALDTNLLHETLTKDINDKTIKEIIIPTFVLKTAFKKYPSFSEVVIELQSSSKVIIKDFPIIYVEKFSCFDYFAIFMTKISKEYKNLYVRTRNEQIIIECLRRGFKVFIDKTYTNIFDNVTNENSITPKSNIVFFDTCYYIEMFNSYTGLNIINNKDVKKIIFSCILEELVKIHKKDIFYFLVYLINNRKEYNIEFIICSKAYTTIYQRNDLLMLSYIMQLKTNKNTNEIIVYTYDMEFTLQCMSLDIKTISGESSKKLSPSKKKKKIQSNLDELKKVSQLEDEVENKNERQEEIISTNLNTPNTLPILISNNNAYLSIKEAPTVFKDIASGMYSDVISKKSTNYYKIKPGYHIKLPKEKKLFRITEIDTDNLVAFIEKTNFIF